MSGLEIVHLSDLHWAAADAENTKIVVNALLADLAKSKRDGLINPDILVFSGDLAFSGADKGDFISAYDALIKPSLDVLNLDKERFFICPGNHDIDRKLVRDNKYVEVGLRQGLTSVDAVNKFIDDLNNGQLSAFVAIQRLENYYAFLPSAISNIALDKPLLKTFIRDIAGLSVGVATFDTAWRATGEPDDVDRAHLILGERHVDLAIESLATCDLRVAVMHHPLDWLADFDEVATSSRLSANFDLIMCGHTHRALPQTRTSAQGTAILSQTGSCYASRHWFNGYQTVRLALTEHTCQFMIRSYYDTPRREFDVGTNVCPGGSVTFPFEFSSDGLTDTVVEIFLKEMRFLVRQEASDHMNMLDEKSMSEVDAKEAFIVPPLSKRVRLPDDNSTADAGTKPDDEKYEEVTAEEILRGEDNYLITGSREAGKTSLLHYLAVLAVEGVIDRPRIPVIINSDALKSNSYNLKRAITAYYGPVPREFDIDKSLASGNFLFLVDDYMANTPGAAALESQIKDNPQSKWICINKPKPGRVTTEVEEGEIFRAFVNVRIRALPRRSIRVLSRRWSAQIGSTDDAVFEAVMKQLKSDGLPRTGYMVTLILWAMQQEKELDRVNEAMLLSNVADHLLGKADFTQSERGKLDPRAKEITLEYFSEFIQSKGGFVTVNDATEYLSGLFNTKRLPFAAIDVLNELVRCGILDRTDDKISFKYRSLQYYFFALRMKSDRAVFERVLRVESYQDMSREIEMLAGLRRENSDILNLISDDMRSRMPQLFADIGREEYDTVVDRSLSFDLSRRQLATIRKKRLSADQVDDLLDAAERRADQSSENNNTASKAAKPEDTKNSDAPLFELDAITADTMSMSDFIKAGDLLGRVIRNSDFSDFDVKEPATRLVIETMVKFAVSFRKELEKILSDTDLSDGKQAPLDLEETRFIVYYMSKLLTRIISNHLAWQLNSPNVTPMLQDIFDRKDTSLLEKTLIAFLLQHLKAPRWEQSWSSTLR